MMNRKQMLGTLVAGAVVAVGGAVVPVWAQSVTAPSASAAITLAGVSVAPEASAGGQTLKLNGAGVRIRVIIKAYVAALYTKDGKVTSSDALLKPDVQKRLRLVSLRNFTGDELGKLFAKGIESNAAPGEFGKNITNVVRMGEIFAQAKEFKKGDIISVDFMPSTGLVIGHNNKQIGEPFPGSEFATLMFKIWFGNKPADEELRKALLGQSSTANTNL